MYVLPAVRPQPKQPSLWCFKDFFGWFSLERSPSDFCLHFSGIKILWQKSSCRQYLGISQPDMHQATERKCKRSTWILKGLNIGVSESLLAGQTQMQCLLIHPICWIQCVVCTKHYLMSEVANFISCPEILRWIWTRSCVNGKNVCTLLPISVVTQFALSVQFRQRVHEASRMKGPCWHTCSLETYCMISTQFPSNHRSPRMTQDA